MSETVVIDGYRNFEDCDECGFVGPTPTEEPSNPVHDSADIVTNYRHATMDSLQTSAEIDSKPNVEPILTTLNVRTLEECIILLHGLRWVIRRLDELLKQPLTTGAIGVLRKIRLTQVRNVERCGTLIVEQAHEHSSRGRRHSRLDRHLTLNQGK